MAFESNSHAGKKLLHAPPVSGSAGDPSACWSHSCFVPTCWTVTASHLPSGEGTGRRLSVLRDGDLGNDLSGGRVQQLEQGGAVGDQLKSDGADLVTAPRELTPRR